MKRNADQNNKKNNFNMREDITGALRQIYFLNWPQILCDFFAYICLFISSRIYYPSALVSFQIENNLRRGGNVWQSALIFFIICTFADLLYSFIETPVKSLQSRGRCMKVQRKAQANAQTVCPNEQWGCPPAGWGSCLPRVTVFSFKSSRRSSHRMTWIPIDCHLLELYPNTRLKLF